ncbi:MAG: NAD(P)/FAD-dependent oxidoreductase [Nitrososphaeraceae archaeon]
MKIGVVGAGVAGSYLSRMLEDRGHKVKVFESSGMNSHWPVCAWGASKNMLETFSAKAGLNFDNYILHSGKILKMYLPENNIEYLDLKGLVTYDKKRWEHDLLKGIEVGYGTRFTHESFPTSDFDYVLDCTGYHRSLLPKSIHDFVIPAYEYLVENVNEVNEFYVIGYKGARGYFWYFPLGGGRGYVGAGDIDRKYAGIEEFFQKNRSARVIKKIGRPIRLSPPSLMKPFFLKNIIGVGESIGCVFPMLGEGIIPSLICSDLFLEVLDNSDKFDYDRYTKKVLNKFRYYRDVYRIIRLKMSGSLNTLKHFKLLMTMYTNMKREEKRFGFEISFDKMTRLVRAL